MSEPEKIIDFLDAHKVFYKENVDLSTESYSCTGGLTKLLVFPNDGKQLERIIDFFSKNKIEIVIIGGTSNLLFLDFCEYECLISTKNLTSIDYDLENRIVEVASGFELSKFVRLNLMNDSVGFDGLEGIPGTVGGAIFQNAGAYGYFISDHLISVEAINLDGKKVILSKSDCQFKMRHSIFQNEKLYIVKAKFSLPKGDTLAAAKRIEAYHIARHSYQEWVYPNLGSVFVTDTNIYDSFSHKNKYYKFKLLALKVLVNSWLYKRVLRKFPSNKLKNSLVDKYFNLSPISGSFSHKSLNTFLNKGKGSLNIVKYYCFLDEILGDDARLENEIVYSPLSSIKSSEDKIMFDEFISKHPRIKKKLK
ncbi:FAD-binding protein [Vibrio parahaemolyticus]|nr:FAD-binding protein [Vibrio parahaemolyticus]